LLFFCYQITATFGYLTFGTKVSDDLLQSYNSSEPAVLVVLLMYLFKTYTSYPLNLFCARTAIESLWIKMFELDRLEQTKFEKARRFSIVTIWFVVSLFVALFIPNITFVIRYLGALAAAFMFIFPGLCILTVGFENNFLIKLPIRSWLLIFASIIYVALGTFIVGLVVTQSVLHDFNFF
jgi:solute carrier family 38 (sodium-coupled neutral amino acid transporter), member 7/8